MIKFSNKSLSQKDWTVMFRIGPAWDKVLINYGDFLGHVQHKEQTPFPIRALWEIRIGIIRVKPKAEIKFDCLIIEQPENLDGIMLYKIFKFI